MPPSPRCEICGDPGVASVNGHGMCGKKACINAVIGRNTISIRELIRIADEQNPRYRTDAGYQPPDEDVRPPAG